jgi:hypothetical protein
MYSAGGFQGLIPSPHFSGLFATQNGNPAGGQERLVSEPELD